jgi:simple sugar transport system permease protein
MSAAPDDTIAKADTSSARALLGRSAAVIRSGAIFILLVALAIGFTAAQPAFIGLNNLMSILQAVSVVAILGAGVTVTLAVGGFDLSIGAVAASSVMAASYAMIVLGLDAFATVVP